MSDNYCPNYKNCRLVTTTAVIKDEAGKTQYLEMYCHSERNSWEACRRYTVKKALQFCPDFVLPDTKLSLDDIIHKFDELNQ